MTHSLNNKQSNDEQLVRAKEAWHILNEFTISLTTATGIIRRAIAEEEKSLVKLPHPDIPVFQFTKMIAFNYIVMCLYKWSEFWKSYKDVIPSELKEPFKNVVKEIDNKGVIQYRNQYVGHIHDKYGHLMTEENQNKAILRIVGSDAERFLYWINSGKKLRNDHSLVYLAQNTRDFISKQCDLPPKNCTTLNERIL